MSTWIRLHPLVAFFVLAYAISWVGLPFLAGGPVERDQSTPGLRREPHRLRT